MQGQTTQTQLDQIKLMQQFTGTWRADYAKDTVEVWDCQPYGKANIITVTWHENNMQGATVEALKFKKIK